MLRYAFACLLIVLSSAHAAEMGGEACGSACAPAARSC